MTEAANITDYYEADTFKRIKDFAEGKETPFVVIDTATIDRQYDELVEGFPYAKVYAEEIARFLNEDFGVELPEIIIEPGRSLISNAGVLVSEVVLISRKSRTTLHRWVFTDVGKFSGLIETLDEAIKFPVWTEKVGEGEDCVIAGPTCDSADIMYEHRYPSINSG